MGNPHHRQRSRPFDRFYRDVVGLTLARTVPERHVAFFWIGQPRQAMLGLWSTLTSPMGMELSLRVPGQLETVVASVAALRDAGLQPMSGAGEVIDEPEVIAWIPSASVYFRDPDGHSLEYIAMLPEAASPEMKNMPLSRWRSLHRGADD